MFLSDKRIVLMILFLCITLVAQEKVSLTTREYDNYRRFILEIPENSLSNENSFIKPVVNSEADSGQFSITIQSEKIQQYAGERLRKSEGEIPVRFVISYPDSNSILIQGNTTKFDKITSFYIMDENKYVFDIYKYDTDDNYYTNSVQLLNNEKVDNLKKKLQDTVAIKAKNTESNPRVNKKESMLGQSVKTAAMILSGLAFIIIATYFIMKIYTGSSLFKDISKLSQANDATSSKTSKKKINSEIKKKILEEQIRENNIENENQVRVPRQPVMVNESAVNSMLFDKKERQIRKIMNQKKLNYNEAEMVFNLTHGSYVG